MKLKKDTRGMTLVETLVGATLLAMCGMILVTGFVAASSLMRKGTDLKTTGQQAAALVDGSGESYANMETSHSSGTISFEVDGTPIVIEGSYTTAADDNGKSIFNLFVPND